MIHIRQICQWGALDYDMRAYATPRQPQAMDEGVRLSVFFHTWMSWMPAAISTLSIARVYDISALSTTSIPWAQRSTPTT